MKPIDSKQLIDILRKFYSAIPVQHGSSDARAQGAEMESDSDCVECEPGYSLPFDPYPKIPFDPQTPEQFRCMEIYDGAREKALWEYRNAVESCATQPLCPNCRETECQLEKYLAYVQKCLEIDAQFEECVKAAGGET